MFGDFSNVIVDVLICILTTIAMFLLFLNCNNFIYVVHLMEYLFVCLLLFLVSFLDNLFSMSFLIGGRVYLFVFFVQVVASGIDERTLKREGVCAASLPTTMVWIFLVSVISPKL